MLVTKLVKALLEFEISFEGVADLRAFLDFCDSERDFLGDIEELVLDRLGVIGYTDARAPAYDKCLIEVEVGDGDIHEHCRRIEEEIGRSVKKFAEVNGIEAKRLAYSS
jgi:hypothetical protein